MLGGNCPVQAEGLVDGCPFYFRARGEGWSFSASEDAAVDPVADPDWHVWVRYRSHDPLAGDPRFAAGWMDEDEARSFIEAAARWWRQRHELGDGSYMGLLAEMAERELT